MAVYAVADKVPEGCYYLTAGKEYEVTWSRKCTFDFTDDKQKSRFSTWNCSGHLNGGNWRRVEK